MVRMIKKTIRIYIALVGLAGFFISLYFIGPVYSRITPLLEEEKLAREEAKETGCFIDAFDCCNPEFGDCDPDYICCENLGIGGFGWMAVIGHMCIIGLAIVFASTFLFITLVAMKGERSSARDVPKDDDYFYDDEEIDQS